MTTIAFAALPNEEAIAYFKEKGFANAFDRFSWKDVWGEEHARSFTVAKAVRDDVLTEIRDALLSAIEDGTTLETFKAAMEPKLRELGWWGKGIVEDPKTGEIAEAQLGSARRLRVIYDTNLRTANSAGRWARVQRNKRLMPFLTYIQIDRPSARDAHKPWHGITLPVDHEFWKTHYAPNGWFCGCMIRQVSARTVEKESLTLTTEEELAPFRETRPYFNDRLGITEQVPVGIDPGFAHNPGLARFDPSEK